MSKGLDIRGQRQWILHRNDGSQELATPTEALAEEDDLAVSKMTTEASIEEAEDTTRLSECLRRRRRRCVYGQPEVLTTTTEASIEEAENTMRLSERLQPRRRRYFYWQRILTTTTATSEE